MMVGYIVLGKRGVERSNELQCYMASPKAAGWLDSRSGAEQINYVRAKELAFDAIKKLPEDATMHDVTQELYAAAVREGLEELDRGEGIPHEEAKRRFQSWFTK
jgi:predicted transcriptional regulator